MTRPGFSLGHVRMRKFIDQQHGRSPLECSVQVKLTARHTAIVNLKERKLLESLEQPLGFGPSVRLDIADHDVNAGSARAPCRFEHRIGLANSGRSTKKNLQP